MTTMLALFFAMGGALQAHSPALHPLAVALVGSWNGTLEYRDYRSDGRVTLPTKLVVEGEANEALRFAYTYDEGKGRVVSSTDRVTISSSPPSYRVQSADGKYDATFEAQGLNTVTDGAGTVTLSGRGRENEQDVDLRITITVATTTLTMLRESRRAGGEWRFRNRYSFTRVN